MPLSADMRKIIAWATKRHGAQGVAQNAGPATPDMLTDSRRERLQRNAKRTIDYVRAEIAASRPRMLTADEVKQLRREMKRDAALLRAEFAKRNKPHA